MVQMKEQIKTPEKELSDEEIDNLSDAEFKTLVIRMTMELIEHGCKMKGQMKATQVKSCKTHREPTVKGRKLGLKSTIWNKRKK